MTTRVPYRAPATPPVTPTKLRPAMSGAHNQSSSSEAYNRYPESPTGHVKPLPPSGRDRDNGFPLSRPKRTRWGVPRAVKSPRRLVALVTTLGVVLLLVRMGYIVNPAEQLLTAVKRGLPRWGTVETDEAGDGLCQFLSTMDAYRRDLDRLHAFYPSNSSTNRPRAAPHAHHRHLYSSTGHLLVSDRPDAPHPIPILLGLGEKRWEELLSRQSRTLEEAVQEYTRRYGRQPPKGFDVWWEYAMLHNLVLPDEYDRINLDLAPFFALPRHEMRRRMEMVEQMKETFTLIIKDGQVDIEILDPGGLEWGGTMPRAQSTAELISAFSRFLPDMQATFSIFDQPQIYLSWARRGSLVDLGLSGQVTEHLQETDDATVRLSRSCQPESNYRQNKSFVEGRSFIYDTLEAGDVCQNPYLTSLHGLLLEPHDADSHPRPHTQLLPLFSLAKTSINSDILITPLDQFHDPKGQDPEWDEKRDPRLAWRGSPTGISVMTAELDWRNSHRIRLHHFANDNSTEEFSYLAPDFDVGPGDLGNEGRAQRPMSGGHERTEMRRETMTRETASRFFYDVALAGEPIQCAEEDGSCDDLRREIHWAPHQRAERLNQHKFLLDIDGNGWSGRFRRLMSTNSVVIKTGIFTEWFQPHLIPWFMYIPSKLDFSDLADILAFFRGTPNEPELAFDETAKAIAMNGKCFVERMFRMEDLQAYMMRLFLEYARLVADESEDMDFYYDPSTEFETFTEKDECPAGEVCTPDGEAGVVEEKKLPWEEGEN